MCTGGGDKPNSVCSGSLESILKNHKKRVRFESPAAVRQVIRLGTVGDSGSVMQFPVTLSNKHSNQKGVEAHLLVDTGASDCFIDSKLATRLGLRVHGPESLCALADTSTVTVYGYTYVSVEFSTVYRDEIKCLVIDLPDIDLILGQPWMLTRDAVIKYQPPSVLI
jgi:Aspartyl protease